MRKPIWLVMWLALAAAGAWGATFGKAVAIGGQAADIALDEPRGVLYAANFTAGRIDVVTLADGAVHSSLNVAAQPNGVALSPDGLLLVVTHYGNWQAPRTNQSALTVINLDDRTRRTFALGYLPLGVAFGADGLALVVTTNDVLLFDPVSGVATTLANAADLAAKALPAEAASTPGLIVQASVAASCDGLWIYGLAQFEGGVVRYRYGVRRRELTAFAFISSPPMGPRVISPSQDGSTYAAGWALFSNDGTLLSQFHRNVTGTLNIGTHAIDQASGTVYAQVPETGVATPLLLVSDADNLRVRETLLLPENFAGKSVLNAAADTLYGISDSGVLIVPVGTVRSAPRVAALQPDLVFRGNFCDRKVMTQELTIADPGGGHTDFQLTASHAGIRLTPSAGVTPATVKVQIDPAAFANQNGTVAAHIEIASAAAVNVPAAVRVLINGRNPDQRGSFWNVPGTLVDLLTDPVRDRFYILRQDTFEALVFDATTFEQVAALRTSNTPTQMAITFDRKYLLIGHDNSQLIYCYDLDTLEQQPSIVAPFGHYPRSVAVSGKAILGASRLADGSMAVENIDLLTQRATTLSSLGVFENKLPLGTVLAGSPNGASILAAAPDGRVWLYNANADTFVASRKDFTALSGAYAASSYDLFVVDNHVLNASLAPARTLESGTGSSSGFVFVDDYGFRSTAPDAAAPGVVQRVAMASGTGVRPTRIVEAPLLPGGFSRTLAALRNRGALVSLTVSGFTVLPWSYDAATAPPRIQKVVNAADQTAPVAPGGLISAFGTNFGLVNVATKEVPLPTALGESCLTVNGVSLPMLLVSPTQVNAQLPFNVDGNGSMVLRTPAGVSDTFNLTIQPAAPSVFRSGTAGPETGLAMVLRAGNGEIVTGSNPIHPTDTLLIYATGLGRTDPEVEAGQPAPADPAAQALIQPSVMLGGTALTVTSAALQSGEVGVYEIRAVVPWRVPEGMDIPLTITQGGYSTTVAVRVVN